MLGIGLLVAAGCTSSSSSEPVALSPSTSISSIDATSSTPAPTSGERLLEPTGWEVLPTCGSSLVGFEIDDELSPIGWIASAQIDRASVGLSSDISSVLDLGVSLSAEHLVANGFRTEDEQIDIQESIPYYREPFFQAELGTLRWDHSDKSTGLVPVGHGRFVAPTTSAGASTVLPMVDRARVSAVVAGVAFDVEAVEVRHSMDDLEALHSRIAAQVPDWWLQIDTRFNAVAVDLGFVEPSDQERWPFEDGLDGICRRVGNPVGDFGPQPASGDGWRLLAITDSGVAEPVSVAVTGDEFVDLWADLVVPDDLPAVDFTSEIVVVFFELRGFPPACDRVIFDGVEFGDDQVSGQPRNVHPVGLQGCLAIGLPRSFVVAIDRSRLPSKPFLIRRDVQPWSYDVEREQIMIDLTHTAREE